MPLINIAQRLLTRSRKDAVQIRVQRYEKIFTYAREKRIFLLKVKKKGYFFTNYYTFCTIRAEKGPFLW